MLIQNAYGDEHQALLSKTESLHRHYCDQFGVTYSIFRRNGDGGRTAHWAKIDLLMEALRSGYDQAAWLDTDCVIVDPSVNIFEASGYGVAVCECFDSPTVERHLNTGFVLVSRSPEVLAFLETWRTSPPGGKWEDQSAFISLMAHRPHREMLTILPNRYNSVAIHMDSSRPVVRAFHGDPERREKISALVETLNGNSSGRYPPK